MSNSDKDSSTGGDPSAADVNSAEGMLARIAEIGRKADGDKVAFGKLLDEIGSRSQGPLLLLPSLIALLPTGAIPTVPTIMGVVIFLIAAQIIFSGGGHVWLPGRIQRLSVGKGRLEKAVKAARPWAKRMDAVIRPRLSILAKGPAVYVVALLSMLMAMLMPPLELVPFAVFMPATVLVVMSLGLTVGDGVWVLAGFVLGAAAFGVSMWLIWGIIF